MKQLFLLFTLFALGSSVVFGQVGPPTQVVLVDGLTGDNHANNGRYSSVTAALAANSQRPLLIRVEGMSIAGVVIPYDDQPHSSSTYLASGESFPIEIPSLVEIRSNGGGEVIFQGPTTGSGSLFKTPSNLTGSYSAGLKGITLLGAGIGVEVNHLTNNTMSFTVAGCTFRNCVTGLQASASNGPTPLELNLFNCTILDSPLAGFTPPSAEFGVSLIASDSGGGGSVGRINATIDSLQTIGAFNGTSIAPDSKIISVVASGESLEFDGSGIPSPISEVNLDVNGCTLFGDRKNGGGWTTGIFAHAFGTAGLSDPQQTKKNYTAGFDVQVTGSTISSLLGNGVFAKVECDGRGEVNLTGSTEITAIGNPSGPNNAPTGSGAYFLHFGGGYLLAKATNAEISGCESHGVQLKSLTFIDDNSCMPDHDLAEGLMINFRNTTIFGNLGDGVNAQAGQQGTTADRVGGIVGGARYGAPNQFVYNSSARADKYAGGQGKIFGCKIYGNLGDGISTRLEEFGAANFRVIRSLIWNNQQGGWRVEITDDKNRLACPILFSTIASNGGYSASIDVGGFVTSPNVTLDVDTAVTGGKILHTKFFGTIFARPNQASDNDFGGWLAPATGPTNLQIDQGIPPQTGYLHNVVYANSCRAKEEITGAFGRGMFDWVSTEDEAYSVNWWSGSTALLGSITDPLELRLHDFNGDGKGNTLDYPSAFNDTPLSIRDWIGNLAEVESFELNNPMIQGRNITGAIYSAEIPNNKGAFNE